MCLFQVIPGATSKTLVLPRSGGNGLTKEDSGRYQCMVTYQDLKEITNNATLDVFSEYLFTNRICNLLMNCCNIVLLSTERAIIFTETSFSISHQFYYTKKFIVVEGFEVDL